MSVLRLFFFFLRALFAAVREDVLLAAVLRDAAAFLEEAEDVRAELVLLRGDVLPARTAAFVREAEVVVRRAAEVVPRADDEEDVFRVPLVPPLLVLPLLALPDAVPLAVRTGFLIYDGSCGPLE